MGWLVPEPDGTQHGAKLPALVGSGVLSVGSDMWRATRPVKLAATENGMVLATLMR